MMFFNALSCHHYADQMFRGPSLNSRTSLRVSPHDCRVGRSEVSIEAFMGPLGLRSLQVLLRPLWALVLSQVAPRALQAMLERAVPRGVKTSLLHRGNM